MYRETVVDQDEIVLSFLHERIIVLFHFDEIALSKLKTIPLDFTPELLLWLKRYQTLLVSDLGGKLKTIAGLNERGERVEDICTEPLEEYYCHCWSMMNNDEGCIELALFDWNKHELIILEISSQLD